MDQISFKTLNYVAGAFRRLGQFQDEADWYAWCKSATSNNLDDIPCDLRSKVEVAIREIIDLIQVDINDPNCSDQDAAALGNDLAFYESILEEVTQLIFA